ncbi:MAG TPA: DNA repair and recombination protein RadB [Candidatus Woesearchaeota archaeon]|nr:DNA repair and recombination protein RadB [Candidatus Woesearchaeota archaeon]
MELKQKKQGTGISFLDDVLKGGFDSDTITTIYGPPGSGKTNICIVFSNHIAKNGKIIYIDTENGFSIDRLRQINSSFEQVIQNIIFLTPKTFEEQTKAIELLDKEFSQDIKAIVIDSIALLYRLEIGKSSDVYEVNKQLGKQLLKLSVISREKSVPVVITTQVYSDFSKANELRLIGGDIISYISKTIIELGFPKGIKIPGARFLEVKKHRTIAESTRREFAIKERGVFGELKPKEKKVSK